MLLETIFLVLVGILIAVGGINTLQSAGRLTKSDHIYEGSVNESRLKTMKDAEGNTVQHYYDLQVVFSRNGKNVSTVIRSTAEYVPGDRIRLMEQGTPAELVPFERPGGNALSGILEILIGICIGVMPFIYQHVSQNAAGIMLAAVFLLLGCVFLNNRCAEGKAKLDEYHGVVTDRMLYQSVQSSSKFLRKNSWYPIVSWEKDGVHREFLSHFSTSMKTAIKIGKEATFWYDPQNFCIVEKKAASGSLILALVFFAIGAFGIISTILG